MPLAEKPFDEKENWPPKLVGHYDKIAKVVKEVGHDKTGFFGMW